MKRLYFILALIGFVIPNIWVAQITVETGNILLWTDPVTTFSEMFATPIATVFVIDLLIAVLVFFIWSYKEANKIGMPIPWSVWIATMVLGLAGGFPYFLYRRELFLQKQ